MIRTLLAFALALTGVGFAGAAPVNSIVSNLVATAQHPRNSEGAFITLRSGRVLFLYSQFSEGTSDFSPCRIAEMVSDDQGRTWSEPRVLFSPEPNTMEMSVSLLRLASGKIALFTVIKRGTSDCRPYLRISGDEGASWSAPRSLLDAPGYFVLNNDRVIQTSRGRLILPLAFHRGLGAADDSGHTVDLRGIALWYYSDDDGTTWKESRTWWTLPVASVTGLQEPGVVELADGSLLSWFRTDQGCQYESRSRDDGETWSAPQPMQLRSPASPASIKRMPGSPNLLAVFNDFSGQFPFVLPASTYRGRTPLVASLSADGGTTWRTGKLLESNPEANYCYTAIHFAGGAVLLSYMDFREGAGSAQRIRRIELEWIAAPLDSLAERAKAILYDVLERDETWIKIHAAEALLVGGEAVAMRHRFLELAPASDSLLYRVGVWRVLATTSATKAERARCIERVGSIFMDPDAPDRSQALETLCKLGVPLTGVLLNRVRSTAADESDRLRPLALWSLAVMGDQDALRRIAGLLSSPVARARVIAAYSLRWLRTRDPATLHLLAQAADTEPPGTDAQAYLLSAAFALDADPARKPAWRAGLEQVLARGSMEARWEAFNGMLADSTSASLSQAVPLLDDPGADTRVGAAMTILYVRARE